MEAPETSQEVEESQLASDTAQQHWESTSCFNQLPRDTLAEIFVRCLPEVSLWPTIVGRSTKNVAPLLLCNVCSTWRTVALATPRLWQTLFLDFKRATPKSKVTEEAVAMTHIWIRRSGVLPLTLSLQVKPCRAGKDNHALGEALLNALFNYASRWEHVGFSYLPIPLSQLEHMPCLRTLCVLADESTQFPFASCPKLASIFWYFKSTVSSAPLPWHQLTHIHLDDYTSTPDMIFVIQSCPKLTDLSVTLNEDEVPESLPREQLVNKSLRKLQISGLHTSHPLLNRLKLPALTDIQIEVPYEYPVMRGFQEVLLGFFSRSKCKLNRMVLQDCGFNDEELLECLTHYSCTGLVELEIANADDAPTFTNAVLLALTDLRPVEHNLLLPKLARLTLDSCVDASPGSVGTMALSRCISQDKVVQFRFLKIAFTDLDEWDIVLLRLAEIRGLDFRYNHYG